MGSIELATSCLDRLSEVDYKYLPITQREWGMVRSVITAKAANTSP